MGSQTYIKNSMGGESQITLVANWTRNRADVTFTAQVKWKNINSTQTNGSALASIEFSPTNKGEFGDGKKNLSTLVSKNPVLEINAETQWYDLYTDYSYNKKYKYSLNEYKSQTFYVYICFEGKTGGQTIGDYHYDSRSVYVGTINVPAYSNRTNCGVPTNLTITDNGDSSFSISATKGSSGNGTTASRVKIEYSYDNKNWYTYSSKVKVTENKTVYARAKTISSNPTGYDSAYCSTVSKTINALSACGVPTININDNGNNSFTISAIKGSNGSNNVATKVQIEYSYDNSNWYTYDYIEKPLTIFIDKSKTVYARAKTIGTVSGYDSDYCDTISQSINYYSLVEPPIVNIIDNNDNTFTVYVTAGGSGNNNESLGIYWFITTNGDTPNTSLPKYTESSKTFNVPSNSETSIIKVLAFTDGSYSDTESSIIAAEVKHYSNVITNGFIKPSSNQILDRKYNETTIIELEWNAGTKGHNTSITKYLLKILDSNKNQIISYEIIDTFKNFEYKEEWGDTIYFSIQAISDREEYNGDEVLCNYYYSVSTHYNPAGYIRKPDLSFLKGTIYIRDDEGNFHLATESYIRKSNKEFAKGNEYM